MVSDLLASAPPCIIATWHHPALKGSVINPVTQPMWALLADNGGDLSLHGHAHYLAEYRPMNGDFTTGGDAHMVEVIAGAGGHSLANTKIDPRLAWPKTQIHTPGAIYVTLVGAANGGEATALSWEFRDVNGNVLRTGGTTC